MKKEIVVTLNEIFPSDFLDNGLTVPAGLATIPGGSRLHFESYEKLQELGGVLMDAHETLEDHRKKQNVSHILAFFDQERADQEKILEAIDGYARNFLENIIAIEGIAERDRFAILHSGIKEITESEDYFKLNTRLKELIRRHRVYVNHVGVNLEEFAGNQELDFDKIKTYLKGRLEFLSTRLASLD